MLLPTCLQPSSQSVSHLAYRALVAPRRQRLRSLFFACFSLFATSPTKPKRTSTATTGAEAEADINNEPLISRFRRHFNAIQEAGRGYTSTTFSREPQAIDESTIILKIRLVESICVSNISASFFPLLGPGSLMNTPQYRGLKLVEKK